MYTLGCIGCGNMGAAILQGLLARSPYRLLGHDRTRAKVEAISVSGPLSPGCQPRHVEWCETPADVAAQADIIVLAVKPYQISDMLAQIRPALSSDKVVLSVAAAIPLEALREGVQGLCPVARVMPNLPVVVGKGVFALCLDDPAISDAQSTLLQEMFALLGLTVVLPEAKFSAFSCVVGCGPAFICLFMEGLENAAVTLGFKAEQAHELVAAMVEGTASLALQDSSNFAAIRSRVCSPGGTTIQGVNHLERHAVRAHVTDAVLQAMRRDQEMAKV